jgi:hypothetical protein
MNPYLLMEEADRMARAAAARSSKAQAMLKNLSQPMSRKGRDQLLSALKSNLQALDADLNPAWLVQHRQSEAIAHPRVHQARKDAPPEGLVCKKCGRECAPEAFFFDDGQGTYGYTERCAECRPARKRKR